MTLERLLHLLHWLKAQQQRHRSRRQLRHLDDHLLADIGIDRATAEREVCKPLWQ
ncbi:DUF1127 domain-containing protein [Billgrantia endophytica]|uniref:DUF1127 domain-containing protein n=1 Tax=Billgrantia endophytica TaxID=2033802 RepID=A0A2N7U2J8_9GAMM|nr:DUF1127 domain-containing protein [Halomonas endophytica]PMR74649.1 DUF1127 domain-containing protein [Halomonas endophytica]